MPATSYKVWGWGGLVHAGNNRASNVAVGGVAKCAGPGSPYELINEVICADLGRAIRLPIPPGVITTRESDKVLHYVSLDFAESGQRLPPADAQSIARNHPNTACGVILFDLWTGNADRHTKNLAYDETSKSLQLFDHGYALLGTDGCKRLKEIDDVEIIDRHCLSNQITSIAGFEFWNERIKSVPKFFIAEAVTDAVKIGLSEADAQTCSDFLISRRSRLKMLIRKHMARFSNVKPMLPGLIR